MQHKKFTDYNDLFGFSDGTEYEFYNLKNVYDDFQIKNNSNLLMTIQVSVNGETTNIIREVYTISQMLADIGGFIELVRFICYFFVSCFSIKRLMAYVIENMYLIP